MKLVKTLALSKLTYSATMLPLPKDIVKHIETLIDKFIWNGKKRKIKKQILYNSTVEGGINQTNLQAYFEAIKASWVPRILRQTNQPWTCIPRYYLSYFGKNYAILNFNFIDKAHFKKLEQIPLFYQELVIGFNKAKCDKKPLHREELLNNIIWGNRHLSFKCKDKTHETLYNKHWIECGIMYLKQIVTQNGKLDIERIKT